MVPVRFGDEHDAGPLNGDTPKPTSGAASTQLFREEALRHFASSHQTGALLRLPPAWLHATAWLIAALVLVAAGFARFGSVSTYVPGRGAYVLQPGGSLAFIARLEPPTAGQGLPPIGSRLLVRRESGPVISLKIDRVGSSVVAAAPWACGELSESESQTLAAAVPDASNNASLDSTCHDVWVQSGRRSLWAVVRERLTR